MVNVTSYPMGSDYREALYNTKLCFRDPALIGGVAVLDPLGMPKAISGNFASVFTIRGTDGRRWAVKCFTRYVPDQIIRYQQISKSLRTVTSKWKVEFEYLPEGLLCKGNWYPILKMEWIEATGLLSFVERHISEQRILVDLATKFGRLVQDLARYGIAHGDLQHGNILVTPVGDLRLIDYDGTYVPGLENLGASEIGHANYQSPARRMANWGPDIDRFSSWVIYASLSALAFDPTLWPLLHADGDEALLFHKSDFDDRDSSRVRYALANSAIPEIRKIARDIDFLWSKDLRAIPPLETVTGSGLVPVPAAADATASSLMPDWLWQAQSVSPSNKNGTIGTAAWLSSHLPASPSVDVATPSSFTRATSVMLFGGAFVLFVLSGFGIIPTLVGIIIALVFLIFFWATSVVSYYRTSVCGAKRKSWKTFKDRASEATGAKRRLGAAEKDKRNLERVEENEKSVVAKKADKARSAERKDLDTVARKLDTQIAKLERQVDHLQSQQAAEVSASLRVAQQAHVENILRNARIGPAKISGIGPTIQSELASYGILSAADFTGIGSRPNSRGGQEVCLRLKNGALVSPRGVGQAKANRLNGWRYMIESSAQASRPTTLPVSQVNSIAAKYSTQRQMIVGDQQAVRAQAAAEQDALRVKWGKTHADLAQELSDVSPRFVQLHSEKEGVLAAARKQAGTAEWRRDFTKRELDRYRKINYQRYLRKMITG